MVSVRLCALMWCFVDHIYYSSKITISGYHETFDFLDKEIFFYINQNLAKFQSIIYFYLSRLSITSRLRAGIGPVRPENNHKFLSV